MTSMEVIDPRLVRFVRQMKDKLALSKNIEKQDWRELPEEMIVAFLLREVEELREALKVMKESGQVQDCARAYLEAVDVANIAFIIGDWIETRPGVRR